MIFNKADYDHLHSLVFRSDYPGYKPNVLELPNGDGKVDAEKRYAHVATKYFKTWCHYAEFGEYLIEANLVAIRAAKAMGVPEAFYPRIEHSALRVLEYPPGAGSHMHTDFDLFTLMCYRDQFEKFHLRPQTVKSTLAIEALHQIDPQGHMGELGEAIGLGPAMPHEVDPSSMVQHSIVYFAIPDHEAVLPSGVKVGTWLKERLARSRAYR